MTDDPHAQLVADMKALGYIRTEAEAVEVLTRTMPPVHRAGITFTKRQMRKIRRMQRRGKTVKAQAYILKLVESR